MKDGRVAGLLDFDAAAEADRITDAIRRWVAVDLRRKGAVVGLSGGIDSSVVAALCVRALGPDRVFGICMPEAESDPESTRLGMDVANHLSMAAIIEDIAPTLEALGCYARRDEALREVVPGFGNGWKCKIVLPSVVDDDRFRIFSVVASPPGSGEDRISARLTPRAYAGVVAATNFKQRVRAMLCYYHADRLNYAVAGTPNRLEYDQGFFVKNGDGAADLKPIAHLYKTWVYALGCQLGLPDEILCRPPTTDTWSLPQSQEEFFFSLPYGPMDLCLAARNAGVDAADVAAELGLETVQVERVYRDIDNKRRMAGYLHARPLVLED